MTDQHDEPDSYPWMTAPAHLMTRRQLRAAGLRPNGQEPVAVMVRRRRGRQVIAQLFDSRTAAPKRAATPAQLRAVAKAIRAHQLSAARRRGLTEADLAATGDPGAAWTTTSENTEKGNTMSAPTTALAETTPAPAQLGVPAGAGQQLTYFIAAMALTEADHRSKSTPR